MIEATKEAIEYMSRIHPLYDSTVMRVDRLPKGWLFSFECRPNGADPTWSPQRRVAYLDKGTRRMAWDMLIADQASQKRRVEGWPWLALKLTVPLTRECSTGCRAFRRTITPGTFKSVCVPLYG